MPRTLVTAALPYANGPIHLGHVAGAYLPADIYTRFLRLAGEEVAFICGTDEHGAPITITADQQKVAPADVVARYHTLQDAAFRALDVKFDIYSGTSTCPPHRPLAQEFFTTLHRKGDIEPRETQQYFCLRCARFLPDRYVEGTCPHCQSPEARGDQCDACGKPLDELIAPKCKLCGTAPERRPTTHWFFRLDRYAAPLRAWLAGKQGWRENVRAFAENFIGQLRPRAITRDLAWGVPVPLPDATGKVLYVWFDAPIGYISFTKEWCLTRQDPDGWARWWQGPDARIVHFIGKDNIVFHAVIWPAMLMGVGGYALPAEIPANEFLTLAEGKFSKSAGRGFNVADALAAWPADAIRWYLTAIAPETKDSAFSPEDLMARADEELADVVGNLVQRALAFVARYLDGRVPAVAPADDLRGPARAARDGAATALRGFRFREALRAVLDFAREGNRYVDRRAPWTTRQTDPSATAETISTVLAATADLSVLLAPFVPSGSRRLRRLLGRPAEPSPGDWAKIGEGPGLPPGIPLPLPEVLFPKLRPDAGAARPKESPMADPTKPVVPPAGAPSGPSVPAPGAPAAAPAPAAPPAPLTIDYFRAVDLRVGTVVACEKHPNADRLLKVKVSIGTEERQVIAGIAAHYTPEALVGTQVIVVANLAPAKLRGEVSQGMILAVADGAKVVLLRPETQVAAGGKVT